MRVDDLGMIRGHISIPISIYGGARRTRMDADDGRPAGELRMLACCMPSRIDRSCMIDDQCVCVVYKLHRSLRWNKQRDSSSRMIVLIRAKQYMQSVQTVFPRARGRPSGRGAGTDV